MLRKLLLIIAVAIVGLVGYVVLVVGVDIPLSTLLPDEYRSKSDPDALIVAPGYGISIYADVPGARVLRPTPLGNMLVSSAAANGVFLLRADADGDGRSDDQSMLLEVERVNGIDLGHGYLYVAQDHQIGRIRYDVERDEISGAYEPLITGLPSGGNHWRKTIRVGPDDGLLYVTIGSTCNVCIEEDDRRAAMLRFTPDGEPLGHFATGLRNTTDFDWSPNDGAMYGVDMGRDLLGDDFPPCEVNQIVEGGFYGWPFANADGIADPDFGADNPAAVAASTAPAHGFRAHNSPLGIRFLRSAAHPPGYRNAAIVPLHGSWNRSDKDGYKVVSLHWSADGVEERDFVTGFLRDNDVGGRPAGVAEDGDGNIFISDDFANRVYRVTPGSSASVRVADEHSPARPMIPVTASAEQLAQGAQLFTDSGCGQCHGVEPGLVRLDALTAKYDVDNLQRYLAMPPQPMPAVESAQDRALLARYLLAR